VRFGMLFLSDSWDAAVDGEAGHSGPISDVAR
jgi:hypothetical protein